MQRCLTLNQLMDLRDVLLNHPLDRSDRVVKLMVKKLISVDKDIEKLMLIIVYEGVYQPVSV